MDAIGDSETIDGDQAAVAIPARFVKTLPSTLSPMACAESDSIAIKNAFST